MSKRKIVSVIIRYYYILLVKSKTSGPKDGDSIIPTTITWN